MKTFMSIVGLLSLISCAAIRKGNMARELTKEGSSVKEMKTVRKGCQLIEELHVTLGDAKDKKMKVYFDNYFRNETALLKGNYFKYKKMESYIQKPGNEIFHFAKADAYKC